MMKAIRFDGYGQDLYIAQIDIPKPGPGEVLVRVEACALNPLDILVQTGQARAFIEAGLPYTPGTDIAGTVEATGEGVAGHSPGARVIGWLAPPRGGGLAEWAVLPAAYCVPLPDGLSVHEGAGIPTAGSTAFHALFSLGALRAGERVLVHAGAGGVGSFAIQFARAAGAHVVATASGDGLDIVRRLGAHEALDHRLEDFAEAAGTVDLVLDLVGGQTRSRSYAVLREGGRLVSAVAPLDEAEARRHGVEASMFFANAYHGRLGEVVQAVGANAVTVPIHLRVPLASFGEAWQLQASRRARGKIVVG